MWVAGCTDESGPYFKLQYKEHEGIGDAPISTSLHRLLHAFFLNFGAADDLPVNVGKLADVLELPEDEFVYRPVPVFDATVSLADVHPISRRRRNDDVWLPFGMNLSDVNQVDADTDKDSFVDVPSDPEGLDGDAPVVGSDNSSDESPSEPLDKPPEQPVVVAVDDPGPVEEPVQVDTELRLPPPVPGLISYGRAPTNRTTCHYCKVPIVVGEWRLECRLRPGTSFRLIKMVHPRCLGQTPREHHSHNYRIAQDWSFKPDLPHEEALVLDNIVGFLQPPAGPAASSAS